MSDSPAIDRDRELHREQLRQSERLATIASLLAGVAHELNNPLAVLLGQAGLLRRATSDPLLLARIEKIVAAAERCAHVVHSFLAFARERQPELRRVELGAVVTQALELVAYALRSGGVEVTVALASDLPALQADDHQLQYVLVSLFSHAEDAMRGQPVRKLTISGERASEGWVRLVVADTGAGLAPEIRRRLCEPFVTSDPQQQGVGLLLCRDIVERHRGRIRLLDEDSPGVRVCLELPVEPWSVSANPEPAAAAAAPAVRLAVLIADDEPVLCELLAEELVALGHRVEVAGSGRQALERLAAGSFDLVLCDVRMPDLDGLALYREAAARHPGLGGKFIFMTGDTLREDTRRKLQASGVTALSKPFTVESLRAAVTRAMGW